MIDMQPGDIVRAEWPFVEVYFLVVDHRFAPEYLNVVPLCASSDGYHVRLGEEQLINTRWVKAEVVGRAST